MTLLNGDKDLEKLQLLFSPLKNGNSTPSTVVGWIEIAWMDGMQQVLNKVMVVFYCCFPCGDRLQAEGAWMK